MTEEEEEQEEQEHENKRRRPRERSNSRLLYHLRHLNDIFVQIIWQGLLKALVIHKVKRCFIPSLLFDQGFPNNVQLQRHLSD